MRGERDDRAGERTIVAPTLIDADLVARLVAAQFPHWSHLPVTAFPSSGTDNAIFRLGDGLVARLPKVNWASEQGAKEFRFLPDLARALPLKTPSPLALGQPALGYPWAWTICPWIDGDPGPLEGIWGEAQTGLLLAGFLRKLQSIPAGRGPGPGAHNNYRGGPLSGRDKATRKTISELADEIDIALAIDLWSIALASPPGGSVWIHGDLLPGNLLFEDGALVGVIDFGCLAVGDSACDLMCAWTSLSGAGRSTFKAAMDCPETDWGRARGWALSWAVIALAFYRNTNQELAAKARRTLGELGVLACATS